MTPKTEKGRVEARLKKDVGRLACCYRRQLVKSDLQKERKGTITAEFTVGTDGKVAASTATGVDDDVSACVAATTP